FAWLRGARHCSINATDARCPTNGEVRAGPLAATRPPRCGRSPVTQCSREQTREIFHLHRHGRVADQPLLGMSTPREIVEIGFPVAHARYTVRNAGRAH